MTISSKRRACCAILFALVPVTAAIAGGPGGDSRSQNPHVLRTRTRSVAVFKNGLGFFVREGTARPRDGWVAARHLPPAKFGTLLVYSREKGESVDAVGSGPGELVAFDGVDAADDLDTRRARLQAAIALQVELRYVEGRTPRSVAGELLSLGPTFAILDTGEQRVAVPIAGIETLQVLDLPVRIHVARDDTRADRDSRLAIAYLGGGITWIPEYSVEILDDGTAELTLRGTLVNEAEDLVHCDVNFVVGVPHFTHSDKLAPIAVGQIVRTIGTALAPPALRGQIMSRGALVQNTVATAPPGGGTVERAVADGTGDLSQLRAGLPQLAGPGGSDFTVYTRRDMTLRKGERAIVTLFRRTIRYDHVYRWAPPARMKHFLVLHNATDTAWTTGPFLAMSHGQPLSEDLLRYTPKAGRCEIPVTTSVNIAHERVEAEIGRELKAHSPRNHHYLDLVTLGGALQLHNFESRDVEVRVEIDVPGKALEASDQGDLRTDPTRLELLQRRSAIRWTVRLKAGESRTVRYRYERYVPSS